jgi:hypothetical protein
LEPTVTQALVPPVEQADRPRIAASRAKDFIFIVASLLPKKGIVARLGPRAVWVNGTDENRPAVS